MAPFRAPVWLLRCVLVMGMSLLALPLTHAANLANLGQSAKAARPGPFGAVEFLSDGLAALPQWNKLLVRVAAETGSFEACVKNSQDCKTASQSLWREAIADATPRPRKAQLEYINGFFNRFPYRTDQTLYGVSEYWASPAEFLARSGDCEDYAIIKYYALRALGFRADELRIVVLRDRIRGIGHAVLAVYTEGDILIMDNLSNALLSHSLYQHYVPQYSLNESGRWLHVAPGSKPLTD